jgi:hypothetical protein
VLDSHGVLLLPLSHNAEAGPHRTGIHDPASTTKEWTYFTLLSMQRDGELPKNFIHKHEGDVERMLRHSDGHAARHLARLAGEHLPGSGDAMERFVGHMNELAHKHHLVDTHFMVPDGEPQRGNFSTAQEIALFSYFLHKEFPHDTHRAGGAKGNTGKALLNCGFDFGKTGSGGSKVYDPEGVLAWTGGAHGGFAAIAGAIDRPHRNRPMCEAAEYFMHHHQPSAKDRVHGHRFEVADVHEQGAPSSHHHHNGADIHKHRG